MSDIDEPTGPEVGRNAPAVRQDPRGLLLDGYDQIDIAPTARAVTRGPRLDLHLGEGVARVQVLLALVDVRRSQHRVRADDKSLPDRRFLCLVIPGDQDPADVNGPPLVLDVVDDPHPARARRRVLG